MRKNKRIRLNKISTFYRITALLLACFISIPNPVRADTDWDGWTDENKEDAWTVFDMTDWSEFPELGIVPSSYVMNQAKASVNFLVRGYEEEIKARLESYTIDYSTYTELMLAILAQRSQGMGTDVFKIEELPNFEGEIATKEVSINKACDLLVECLSKYDEITAYNLDSKLKAVISAWYMNDPAVIDHYTDQKYNKKEAKTYIGENTEISMEDIETALEYISNHYSCIEVKKTGSAYASGQVAAGAAGTTDYSQRIAWLFPNGLPKTPLEMQKYLTWVVVPCKTESGIVKKSIQVHVKLANDIKEIYEEMAELDNFYIVPGETYGYSWRVAASGTGNMSHHSYGVAVDVNPTANPATYWGYSPDVTSAYYNNPQVVDIWKSHGFYWGGDWAGYFYDPMHFSYTNH